MTIIEAAIQRAKRSSEEQARKRGKSPSENLRRQPAGRPVDDDAERAPVIEVPRLEIDENRCIDQRILIGSARDRYSTASDSYRIIRTRLLARMAAHGWHSIAVTSAGPDEGKSVTALNLALALATERKRNVFVLDLDLRNPSLCQYLSARPKAGIGDFLTGRAPIEDLFASVSSESLIVAGGTSTHENSAELLGSQRLDELLAYIRTLDPNALVLADLPPVLSVADAMVVAPKLSAVMLVVSEGITRRDGYARALEVLAATPMAGVVLNQSLEADQQYYA